MSGTNPGPSGWPSRLKRFNAEREFLQEFLHNEDWRKWVETPARYPKEEIAKIRFFRWFHPQTEDEGKLVIATTRACWEHLCGEHGRNADDRINIFELTKFIQETGTTFDAGARMVKYVMNNADEDADGVLDYEEFLKFQATFQIGEDCKGGPKMGLGHALFFWTPFVVARQWSNFCYEMQYPSQSGPTWKDTGADGSPMEGVPLQGYDFSDKRCPYGVAYKGSPVILPHGDVLEKIWTPTPWTGLPDDGNYCIWPWNTKRTVSMGSRWTTGQNQMQANRDGCLKTHEFRFSKVDVMKIWCEMSISKSDPRPWCTSPAEAEEQWEILKQLEDECLDKKTDPNSTNFHAVIYYMNSTLKEKLTYAGKKFEAHDRHYLSLFDGQSDESKEFFARHASSVFSPKNKVHGQQALELIKSNWEFVDWKCQQNDKLRGKKTGKKKKEKTGNKIMKDGKEVDEFKEVDVYEWHDVIDLEEFKALLYDSALVSPRGAEDNKEWSESLFKKYDTDSNGVLQYSEYLKLQREFMSRNGFVLAYWNATNVCDKLCTPIEEGGWGLWPAELQGDYAGQFLKCNHPDCEFSFEDFKNIFTEHLQYVDGDVTRTGWFHNVSCDGPDHCKTDRTMEEVAEQEWQNTPNYPTNMRFYDLLFYMNCCDWQIFKYPYQVPGCKSASYQTAADA